MTIPDANETIRTSLSDDYCRHTLWTGPSKLIAIRTSKVAAFDSLWKKTYKDPTGIKKQPRQGTIELSRLGFDADENVFAVQTRLERAVLQYNPAHYQKWRDQLKGINVKDETQRDVLLDIGGFGENIAVEEPSHGPPMDETTMCIGDLVAIRRGGVNGFECARMRVTGPRCPCFKLNHRFGLPDMASRTQNSFRTGWFYSIEQEGSAQVGDELVLLERPFPDWSVARIQHYQYRDPTNIPMLEEILTTLDKMLVYDVRKIFRKRLTKGVEDVTQRLQGGAKDVFVDHWLREKIHETDRVSEFIFERVSKIAEDSQGFMIAESGSHIRLRFKLKGQNDRQLLRSYSIISGNSNVFRLGIAKADSSRGGSSFLHQNLEINDSLEASSRFANTFPLQPECDTNHVFLAGGIGITAFLDHMRRCVQKRQKFHLHYMIRNKADYAFRRMIEEILGDDNKKLDAAAENNNNGKSNATTGGMANRSMDHTLSLAKVTVYVSADGHRCNVKNVLASHARDNKTHYYVCGSETLSDSVRECAASLEVPDDRLHFEQFSVEAGGDPFVAKLDRSGKAIEVSAQQSLLDALKEAGLEIESSCEAGNCATCRVPVKCGRILHKGTGLANGEKAGNDGDEKGEMLSCVSRGVGTICLDL